MDVQFSPIKGATLLSQHPSCSKPSSVRELRFYYIFLLITDVSGELVLNL